MKEQAKGSADAAPARARNRRGAPRWAGSIFSLIISLTLLALALGIAGMALTGRSLPLPVWAVAEIEDRLNRSLAQSHLPDGAGLSVGAVELGVDGDLTPRFRLRDLRLLDPDGVAILGLPEVAVALEGGALLKGAFRPRSVRLLGAHLEVVRDSAGKIGLSIGGISGARTPQGLAEMLDALDRMFASPVLSGLTVVEADALTLTLTDERAGRKWELGDGRLVLENSDLGVAADLGFTLLDGRFPTQARLTIETAKADSSARFLANVDGMAAGDLAAQAPALAVLGVVDAPISGRILGELDQTGQLKGFESMFSLSAGSIKPASDARPVPFDKAELALRYDPVRQRITLGSLRLESPSVRLRARGTADLLGGDGVPAALGTVPAAVVAQLTFSEVMVDPDGVFAEPVRFDAGNLTARVTLKPFRVEIGELSLSNPDERLWLAGQVAASEGGWEGGLSVAVPKIAVDRLVKLWPVSVVPLTRDWLTANVGQAQLQDLDVGLRFAPGTEPKLALDYEFSEADVRFIRTLPPVRNGQGRATIYDNAYTITLESGHVIAPNGGRVEAGGSVMIVKDIRKFPADAEVRLATVSPLVAVLSLLDQEPFRYLTKAGRPVDLGQGEARLTSTFTFPLKPKILVGDLDFAVTGRVEGFSSSVLVPGRKITVPSLDVRVLPAGMTLAGKGKLDGLSFDASFRQPFGPDGGGQGTLAATVTLSDKVLRGFGILLPEGWLTGDTRAQVEMTIPKAGPLDMTLTSDLVGARMFIPPLGWRKGAKTAAKLTMTATLGPAPRVDAFRLSAPDLVAEGRLTTTKGGALDEVILTKLQSGAWLDATAVITGRGKGRSVAVRLRDGSLDLRKMPKSDGEGEGGGVPLSVSLDQLIVSSGITLTGFRGEFLSGKGGLDGTFKASVNSKADVTGAVVPDRGRTAVRITADNAGRVMAAAGIFENGRGGQLDLTLTPRGPEGQYVGIAAFNNLSVQDAPALAALLSSISVVGLLEQMSGSGLVFDDGDVEFVLNPDGVQITRGTAVGLSLGISFEGAYSSGSGRLDLQGVISPIYILNGIGQIFARKGEGLFGFNYRLTGPAADPSVSVNPLSILTPGMFREIFRRPPPKIEGNG